MTDAHRDDRRSEHKNGDSTSIYNLNDDTVKLIAYSIVSLKRDRECVMPEGEGSVIVTDDMTAETFTSWIIAKYIQKRTREVEAQVKKEPDVRRKSEIREAVEKELTENHKYLRVYYVVSNRWPREPAEFEEREIARLEEISKAM